MDTFEDASRQPSSTPLPTSGGVPALTPAMFHILLALSDRERHGYGIMREVARYTDGQVRLGPGTLYRSIQQMLSDRLIVEAEERPDPTMDDQRRRYYRLTEAGARMARIEADRLDRLLSVARAKRVWRPTRAAGIPARS